MRTSAILTTLAVAIAMATEVASAQPGRGGDFDTSPGPDVYAPVFVSGPSTVSVFATSAVIQWTSDEVADMSVRLTTADGAEVTTVTSFDFVTEHTVGLAGLDRGTDYIAELVMMDPAGNTSEMVAVPFTTYDRGGDLTTSPTPDVFFPVYTVLPTLLEIGDVSVTLSWQSDEPTMWNVSYGTSEDALDGRTMRRDFGTTHVATLTGLIPGVDYFVQIEMYDPSGNGPTVENVQFRTAEAPLRTEGVRPGAFALRQNAPNPFNPSTTIAFSLPGAGHANVSVYATGGQLVRTLVDAPLSAGAHSATWNGLDASGSSVASGIYLYRLEWNGPAGRMVSTRALTLVR